MSLLGVAQTGDRRATLEALRDELAQAIDACGSLRDLASLALRLTDVLEQLDDIPDTKQVSAADEIAARRTARRGASATGKARSKARTSQ